MNDLGLADSSVKAGH